jgi:hypothetical protein
MVLKQRIPLLRGSVWRLAFGARNIATTGQIGDGREAADYVISHARRGDIDDVLAAIDKFAYEKAILISVDDRVTCVIGTIGDDGKTLEALAAEHDLFRARRNTGRTCVSSRASGGKAPRWETQVRCLTALLFVPIFVF